MFELLLNFFTFLTLKFNVSLMHVYRKCLTMVTPMTILTGLALACNTHWTSLWQRWPQLTFVQEQ